MGKVSRRPSRATRPGRIEPEALPGWLQLISEGTQLLNRDYPGWFELLNVVRAARDEIGGWPDWCLLPLAPSLYFCSQAYDTEIEDMVIDEISLMNALFAWEHTRTVWYFDDELARALKDTTSLDAVPSELMYRLPGWAVVTPIGDAVAITWLEYDFRPDKGPELQISVLSRDEDGLVHTPIMIPLRYRTLGEGLRAIFAEFAYLSQVQPDWSAMLHTTAGSLNINPDDVIKETSVVAHQLATQTVARLCYLLAEEPDVSERVPPEPHRGKARRQVRLGTQPAQPIRELDVGFRVGAALRAAQAAESHSLATDDESVGHRRSPVPHLRRAHWHLYWTGPRQGQRTPVLRWIPPVVVAASSIEDVVVPTVRPVRGPSRPKNTV
jgi:hypothetical protein